MENIGIANMNSDRMARSGARTGTLHRPEPSYNSIGTWSVANDRITLRFTDAGYEPYDETYRFSLDGNNLILYDYENPGPNVFVRR